MFRFPCPAWQRMSGSAFFFLCFGEKVLPVSCWQEVVIGDHSVFDNLVVASRWHLRSNEMTTLEKLAFFRLADWEC